MASRNVIDENIKSLCYLLWIFETRVAITIMTEQHQHYDCEEDITMQGQRNAFTTGPAKLNHEDYAIKCVGGRQLHEY